MRVLITGASRGIGFAVALELLRQGHDVWGLSRTPPGQLVDLPEKSGKFQHSICDIGHHDSRKEALMEMSHAGYTPDIVILNAAIEYEEDPSRLSWKHFQAVQRTNVEGACFWVTHWMSLNPRPQIQYIAISSLVAFWPDTACPAYSASKAALSMVFRAWRLRYANESSRFKLVYLGPVHTSINPRFADSSEPSGLAVTTEAVATYLVRRVIPGRRFAYYYPFSNALACRFGSWIPDRVFEFLTRPLRR